MSQGLRTPPTDAAVAPQLSIATAAVAGLDLLRASLLRAALSLPGFGPSLRPLVVQPTLRVALFGSLSIASALLLTWLCPLWMLAVSPLLLGVPHLLADVRYLIVQPGYHRRLRLAIPVGTVLLGAALGLGMRAGLAAVAVTLLCAASTRPRSGWRRLLGLVVVAALVAVGLCTDWYWLDLAMAHVHNAVAVVFLWLLVWLRWHGSSGPSHGPTPTLRWGTRSPSQRLLVALSLALPVVLFVAGSALLLSGVLQARPAALLAFEDQTWLDLDGARWILAPYLPLPWGTRVVLMFAFAQAVHYGVWLRLLPDVARPRPTPRTFAASLRALSSDLGPTLCALAAVLFGVLLLSALFDLAAARDRYFRLAMFHGHLELCALALWWVEGLPPIVAGAPAPVSAPPTAVGTR